VQNQKEMCGEKGIVVGLEDLLQQLLVEENSIVRRAEVGAPGEDFMSKIQVHHILTIRQGSVEGFTKHELS
jgi:hypothetical protein